MSEKSLKDRVSDLIYLPEIDKIQLINWLDLGYNYAEERLCQLSIFYKPKFCREINGYNYILINDNPVAYARERRNHHCGFFFTRSGKLIPNSRYYLSDLKSFIQLIDQALNTLQDLINTDKYTELEGSFIAITKWFITYGHFQDECFALKDFLSIYNCCDSIKPLLDYPVDEELDTKSFKWNTNYEKLDLMLFNGESVNAFKTKMDSIFIKNLILVYHTIHSKNFHSFSPNVAQSIISSTQAGPLRIFLTRSSSYRDILNKSEIEAYSRSLGFSILNPELLEINALAKLVNSSDHIILYWGSAMTNLAYCKQGAKITVIKSDSYKSESLNLWQKMINNYNLQIEVIEAIDNIADKENISIT